MKTRKFYFITTLIILLLVLWAIVLSDFSPLSYQAEQGQVQVAEISSHEVYFMEGEWYFYPNRLIEDLKSNPDLTRPELVTLPHEWPKRPETDHRAYGYGTYQLTLQGLEPGHTYGMLIRDESSAYKVWANGQAIFSNGTVGRDITQHQPFMKTHQGIFYADQSGTAQIQIEVSNFNNERGGMWTRPYFGSVDAIFFMSMREKLVETFLYSTMLTMGLFFFVLYALSKDEKSMLFLSLFSILSALRITLMGHRQLFGILPGISWALQHRMEYLAGYFLIPLFGYLTSSLEFVKPSRRMLKVYHLLVAFPLFLTVFFPQPIYEAYYDYYKILVIPFSLYFISIVLKGVTKKAEGARVIALAFTLMFLGAISELYVEDNPFNVSFATLVMIGLFAEVLIVKFVTLKQQKQVLETHVMTDKLTGVYNRFHLEHLCNASLEGRGAPGPCSVLFIDINRFKYYNDTYGHALGDEILKAVAARLKASVRESDMIFRYGGDEFVILTDITDDQKVEDLILRLHEAVKAPLCLLGHNLDIRLSIGFANYGGPPNALIDAIYKSDLHMYHLKKHMAAQN